MFLPLITYITGIVPSKLRGFFLMPSVNIPIVNTFFGITFEVGKRKQKKKFVGCHCFVESEQGVGRF